MTLTRMLFEGLTRLGKEEKAELAVAEKVEVSEDLKTYTFCLRPSSWNNGDPVTATLTPAAGQTPWIGIKWSPGGRYWVSA